jgi:hypothetical protein
MGMWQIFLVALVQEVPKVLSAGAAFFFVWLVGRHLTSDWSLSQKARELDLAAMHEFHALYGEFFALWKLWNYKREDSESTAFPDASRWDLLSRATVAEGKLEAALVRAASSKRLSSEDVQRLGEFRQLYQRLREAIRGDQRLAWDWSDHPEYRRFKELAPHVAELIRRDSSAGLPKDSGSTILRITSNEHEKK